MGPANYSNTDVNGFGKSGVQVSIKGKRTERFSENPGPGHYNKNDNLIKSKS